MMNAGEFHTLIEAYGADARRWPADRREAAEAFCAADPVAAAAAMAAEADLDQALDQLRPPTASPALYDRILASAPQARAEGGRGVLGWLRPSIGLAMAASCAAGAVAGMLLVQQPPARDAGDDLWAAVSAPGDLTADDESELS